MCKPRDSFLDARAVAGRHPPQRDSRPFKMLEPVGAAAIEALVHGLPDEALQRVDALPHRNIDDDLGVGIGPSVSGVAALVELAPDEPGAAFGKAVHQFKIVREIRHARILELVFDAADVQFGQVMIGWLLQGPTPSPTSVVTSRRL